MDVIFQIHISSNDITEHNKIDVWKNVTSLKKKSGTSTFFAGILLFIFIYLFLAGDFFFLFSVCWVYWVQT